MPDRFTTAIRVFADSGGTVRMADATRAGISRMTLYAMLEEGVLDRLSRGVYRLADLPGLSTPDLVAVNTRVPNGVVCLVSALAFHELTTQVPHAVHLAISRNAATPRIHQPPIAVYRFSGEAFTSGIETHNIDRTTIRVYGPEKSIADIFKYRNKIGMDVALEALRTWCERRRPKIEALLDHARICRVERVIRPYLEAIPSDR